MATSAALASARCWACAAAVAACRQMASSSVSRSARSASKAAIERMRSRRDVARVWLVEAALLGRPGLVQVGDRLLQRSGRCVAGGLGGGERGGVGGAEVGAVAAEHGDPLLAGVGEVGGDQVGCVCFPAAGHADVGRRRPGVLADHDVRGGDGLPLYAVCSGGVRQLHVRGDVVGGQHPRPS
jgi:hypothetical protein